MYIYIYTYTSHVSGRVLFGGGLLLIEDYAFRLLSEILNILREGNPGLKFLKLAPYMKVSS